MNAKDIGFIEQTQAGFDVTEVGLLERRLHFGTFAEALTRLSERL